MSRAGIKHLFTGSPLVALITSSVVGVLVLGLAAIFYDDVIKGPHKYAYDFLQTLQGEPGQYLEGHAVITATAIRKMPQEEREGFLTLAKEAAVATRGWRRDYRSAYVRSLSHPYGTALQEALDKDAFCQLLLNYSTPVNRILSGGKIDVQEATQSGLSGPAVPVLWWWLLIALVQVIWTLVFTATYGRNYSLGIMLFLVPFGATVLMLREEVFRPSRPKESTERAERPVDPMIRSRVMLDRVESMLKEGKHVSTPGR